MLPEDAMKDDRAETGPQVKPAEYRRPELIRWGTLRELTQGGGGTRREPGAGARFTRL